LTRLRATDKIESMSFPPRLTPVMLVLLAFAPLLPSCRSTSQETVPTSQPAVDDPVPPGHLRIGSWNLDGLGPSQEFPRERRRPENLAAYITQSGAAVLALQGVGQDPGSKGRNATLDRVINTISDQGFGDWEYRLFPTQSAQQSQLTGIAWNKRLVRMEDEPYAVPVERGSFALDGAPFWDRLPHAVKFRAVNGSADFIVIPIHTRTLGMAGEDASHRVHEIQRLGLALDQVRNKLGDRDVILIGDFNTRAASETTCTYLKGRGFRDLNAADHVTYMSGLPLDRAFVAADQKEFISATSIQVVKPKVDREAFKDDFSDHYMITFDMKADVDDD
jgi:endonuclease/exonuclease/phosphatase family metal-dependent hydrolase